MIALASSALIVNACASDSSTAPVMGGALASKGGSGGGGGGGGGSGGGGGGGGGGGVITPPTILTGPRYVSESFGSGNPTRFDANGNPVSIFTGKNINGIRAEVPNLSSEVWITPDVSHAPGWGFAVSSGDPGNVLASNNNPTDPSNNAALLPFLQPPGAVTASITAFAGPYSTAVGFATSATTLTGAFETAGVAWLLVRIPAAGFISGNPVAEWELHTNGLAGPSASGSIPLAVFPGTTVLVQRSHRVSVSYDPAQGTVSGALDGVMLRSLPFVVSGVKYVGFQGYGIVSDFRVEAGASSTP
jgi:hypothetical protein